MANGNETNKPLIRISICGNKPLIFNTEDVKRLRCEHHIVGSLQGTLTRFPLQNSFYGLPLLLLPEEVFLILQKGWGQCISLEGAQKWDYPKTYHDKLKCIVYKYLWHQGYFMTSGIKFGGDYIVYLGDPMKFHSHFIVSVQEKNTSWCLKDLIIMGRLAKNTKKSFVLASPIITTTTTTTTTNNNTNDITMIIHDTSNTTTTTTNLGNEKAEDDDIISDEDLDINSNQVECFSIVWAGF